MQNDSTADLEEQLAEERRLNVWLQGELDHQRTMNGELRRAVADLARTFQESLAEAYTAGESGDIAQVRAITRANQANWQHYLQQIIDVARRAVAATPPEPPARQ